MSEEKKPTTGDFFAGIVVLFFMALAFLFLFFIVLGISLKVFNWIVQ